MLTSAEDIIVLSHSPRIPCTTSHKTCHKLYNRRHPLQGAFWARSMGLAGQPGIPPMAAPPEASYRRPEDIIVLSHMPRITRDAYTKYICVHHFFLIGRGTPYRVPLDARSMGSARQTGHTPHGRTSATPSPQRMKILTRKYLLGRVAHECRGHYCFISLTQDTMHYFTQNMPQTLQQKAPLTGCLLGKIHGFGRTTRHTPHGRTSRSFIQKARGKYCFICPTIITQSR